MTEVSVLDVVLDETTTLTITIKAMKLMLPHELSVSFRFMKAAPQPKQDSVLMTKYFNAMDTTLRWLLIKKQ